MNLAWDVEVGRVVLAFVKVAGLLSPPTCVWPLSPRGSLITRGPLSNPSARRTLVTILFIMVMFVISRDICRLTSGISSRSLAWRVLT